MKRTGKELKTLAKQALLGHYGTVVGSILVSYLLLMATAIPVLLIFVLASFFRVGPHSGILLPIGMVVWYLIVLVVSSLLMAGFARICYLICTGQGGEVGNVTYAFSHRPFRFVGLTLLLILLYLVAAVPGIALMIFAMHSKMWGEAAGVLLYLAGYLLAVLLSMTAFLRYSLVLFVLIEDQQKTVSECIWISRDLMEGNRMRLFKLELSFIGMFLLGYLSFGLGFLWILPYLICTNIFFYLSVKEEKYPPVRNNYENEFWG